MPSNSLTPRRRSHGKPPICKSKLPLPPLPPYPPPYYCGLINLDPVALYHRSLALPQPPRPPFKPIAVRNLLCHLYANLANSHWLATVNALRDHWSLFNGLRIIAIPTGPDLVPPDELRARLPPNCLTFTFPNDPRLREVASFLPLLKAVQSIDQTRATFYCHAKGTTPLHDITPNKSAAIRKWRNHMIFSCLTQWRNVSHLLRRYATVGTYKIDYSNIPGYRMTSPSGLTTGLWHYAGTFFWFRNDQVFTRPHWSAIADDPFAAEMWLGGFIPPELAAGIPPGWTPPETNPPDLYHPDAHPIRRTAFNRPN